MKKSFLPPVHFTVSQLRVAACCPRIFYFDVLDDRRAKRTSPRVTRIWEQGGGEATAGGSLFHAAVEKFNRHAAQTDHMLRAIEETNDRDNLFRAVMRILKRDCLNLNLLASKPTDVITNFEECVQTYMGELADIVHYARTIGKSAPEIIEQLFTKLPKRLDVTLHLSEELPPIHVSGRIDYIFFDWRTNRLRIVDYKLAPSSNPNKDQFQVATYALMYHHQHQFQCDADVFYLHPKRDLQQQSWDDIQKVKGRVYQLLASMAAWTSANQPSNQTLRPSGDINYCKSCRWSSVCEKQLGPKSQGDFFKLPADPQTVHPIVEVNETPPEEQDEALEPNNDGDVIEPTEAVKAVEHPAISSHSSDIISLFVGTYSSDQQPTLLPLKGLATHSAVIGAAGSGKTWMAKTIVEEAISKRVPVLAIDPQGDLVQFLRPRPITQIPAELRDLYHEFHRQVEVRVFTPGTSHAIRLSLSPLRMPSEADLSHLSSPERKSEELESMLSGCAGNLVSLAAIKGEADSQRTMIFKILSSLRQQSQTELKLSDVIAGLQAPDSCGIDDADFILKKTDREKLGRKLYAFLEGPASSLFRDGVPVDLDRMVRADDPQRIPLNIIYLNSLVDDQQKQFFTAMLAEEIYRWMLTASPVTDRPALLFYLDEARDFIPAGTKLTPSKPSLLRLFTQGRKYGVGCLLCTQSPRSVDYNAFGNCSTKIIGRLEAAQDVDRVEEWFTMTGAAPGWIAARKGAKPGSFVGRWPGISAAAEGQSFGSRILFTEHGGAWSPDRLEEEWKLHRPHDQFV